MLQLASMEPISQSDPNHFSSALPIIILTRPSSDVDWQELDRGPGYFQIPAGHEVRVRMKSIDDEDLADLVKELQNVEALRFLDLSENRNVSDKGLTRLHGLAQLTGMNLSSCGITSAGVEYLRELPHLAYLNLSFCNKLNDQVVKILENMRSLTYVDLQGCLSITNGAVSRIRRRNLVVYR
jgi:hypothetical protein